MDVSIIIVNYRTVRLILNCIESIVQLTSDISYEIIVVDNNSDDDFKAAIQGKFPDVICLPLEENIGFGRANNEGLKIAKGRNILFLNPDTVLLNNAIKVLSDFLDANNNVGACGGNLYDEDLNPAQSFKRILPSIKWEVNLCLHGMLEKISYGKDVSFNYTDRAISVAYVTGADLMIPASLVKKLHGFDPDFFMYFEETDLCARIKEIGKDIVSVPQAKIQHLEGKSFDGKINIRRTAFFEKGRTVYYAHHFSAVYTLLANAIYGIFLLTHIVLYAFFFQKEKYARTKTKWKYFKEFNFRK